MLQFKFLLQQFEESDKLTNEDLDKLSVFTDDPDFTELLKVTEPSSAPSTNTDSVKDVLNFIHRSVTINQLTPSQSKPRPSAFKLPGASKKKSSGQSKPTTSSDVVDITYFNDAYDMGDQLIMGKLLQKMP
jgi:hypothetical protein